MNWDWCLRLQSTSQIIYQIYADHLIQFGEPTAVHEKVAASMCQEAV